MKHPFILSAFLLFMVVLDRSTMGEEPQSLAESARGCFSIGAAVTSEQVKDPATSALILRQFNCLTGEFEFMPQFLEPKSGKFTFERADAVAAFAAAHHLPLTGHMLCWGQLTPGWMYADEKGKPLPREMALANMKLYIDTVVKHFHGKVDSWNVVNEAISDNGNEWLRDTPAHRAIGDDYIEKAFEFAHDADPDVALYYNDYNIEDPKKLPKTLKLIQHLQEKKVRLDAVGIQGHWLLDYPDVSVIDAGIVALGKTGVKVMITELDVDVLPRKDGADLSDAEKSGANPYKDGIPDHVLQQQARRYADLFRVFKKHRDVITRVTLWGVDDGQSWLNDYPVKGRKNYPLLFDRQLQAKPALQAVVDVLKND
jgi:endo-1,4-beta-xylanase